jgi:hypothetical protein
MHGDSCLEQFLAHPSIHPPISHQPSAISHPNPNVRTSVRPLWPAPLQQPPYPIHGFHYHDFHLFSSLCLHLFSCVSVAPLCLTTPGSLPRQTPSTPRFTLSPLSMLPPQNAPAPTLLVSPTAPAPAPALVPAPRSLDLSTSKLAASVIPPAAAPRQQYLDPVAFSPVNENGSFEFDRVIKAGQVLKRGRKTKVDTSHRARHEFVVADTCKSFKSSHLVLRPVSLSIYSDADHTAVKHSIPLSEITAVARQRKTKRPGAALFTVFTPPRNFHFDARLDEVADQWVHQIRVAARIDEWEDGAVGTSEEDGEGIAVARQTTSTQPIPIKQPTTIPNNNPYAAPMASFSSISSLGAANFPESTHSLSLPVQPVDDTASRSIPSRSLSGVAIEEEKVLRNGWLYLLKSKGGVKKWKPVWAVLRPKSVAVYPNEQVNHTPRRQVPTSH